MARERSSDLRVSGPKLWARFTLSMTIALTVVLAIAGVTLYKSALKLAETVQERTLIGAVQLLAEQPNWEQEGKDVKTFRGQHVMRAHVRYGEDRKPGLIYRHGGGSAAKAELLVPGDIELTQRAFLGLILGMFLLILFVGAAVAYFIANQIAQPIEAIVTDIGQIASGDFKHRTKVRTGGEVAMLARSVDRMAKSLAEGQETELELSIREREIEVAVRGARSAPARRQTPAFATAMTSARRLPPVAPRRSGGDFHEFIEHSDGRLGVAGVRRQRRRACRRRLIGATARAYLRTRAARRGRGRRRSALAARSTRRWSPAGRAPRHVRDGALRRARAAARASPAARLRRPQAAAPARQPMSRRQVALWCIPTVSPSASIQGLGVREAPGGDPTGGGRAR